MKLTDKRFWIFEVFVVLISVGVGYSMLYMEWDIYYTVIFLLCGLLSGFVAYKWFRKSTLRLSLSVWIANGLSVAICFLLPNLNKSTTHLDYLILFLIIYSLISLISYIVVTKIYSHISKQL
jgi:membrane associated rhomboid family serine protease